MATLRLGIGSHSLTARFGGTWIFAPSTSPAQDLTITGSLPSGLSLSDTGSPGNYTVTGVVQSPGPNPATGTVTFEDATNNFHVLATAPLGSATATQAFLPQVKSRTQQFPIAAAVADLDQNGIVDVITINEQTHLVNVSKGLGDGHFLLGPQTYQAGKAPNSLAVGDFNADGFPDLAVASDAGISVLLNKGDGTFLQQVLYDTYTFPHSVAVGDFNGDGVQDLIITDNAYPNSNVSVLFGVGGGRFKSPASSTPVGAPVLAIAVGDFNGDGVLDAATANTDHTLTVLLGRSDGTFQVEAHRSAGGGTSIAAADLNNDGILDIVTSNYEYEPSTATYTNEILVRLGTGNAHFGKPVAYLTGDEPQAVAIGDFNGDGSPDLITANYNTNNASIFINDGKGGFGTAANLPAGSQPNALMVGDFNGDGITDAAVVNFNTSDVSVLLSQVTQSATATLSNFAVPGKGSHVITANYSGDTFHYPSAPSSALDLKATLISTSISVEVNAAGTIEITISATNQYNYPINGAATLYLQDGTVHKFWYPNKTSYFYQPNYSGPMYITYKGNDDFAASSLGALKY